MSSPKTILITGFEPFPSAPENPTADLIEMVRGGEIKTPGGISLEAHVLPTEYEMSWANLHQLMNEFEPVAILNFGLSAKAKGFTLERTAKNEISAKRPDNSGVLPLASTICPESALQIETGLPLEEIHNGLVSAKLPVYFSDDAGGYVCNHLFYQCMNCLTPARPQMSGFIHIPYLDTQRDRLAQHGMIEKKLAALSRDELLRGVEVMLNIVANKGSTSP
jgi:pyroglutamyl-peptidase